MKRIVYIIFTVVILCGIVYFLFLRKARPWTPEWEESIESFQPTSKIMDIIGISKGMEVGEIGAGNGRFAVRLADRVGKEGRIYANDIDLKALRFMKQRIENENIKNMQVILSRVTNPYFPKNKLDVVCVINSYENFSDPVRLLSNTGYSLTDSGKLAIVARDPNKSKKFKKNSVPKSLLIEEVSLAGYSLIKIDTTSLIYDNVYVFGKKPTDNLNNSGS